MKYLAPIVKSCYFPLSIISVFLISILPFNLNAQTCKDVDFKYEINGNEVNFSGSSTEQIAEWNWSFGDRGDVKGQNVKHSYAKPGTYQVCLKVIGRPTIGSTNAGCTGYICKNITITDGTVSENECTLTGDFVYKSDGTLLVLSGTSNEEGSSYSWSISGINQRFTGQRLRVKLENFGVYEVCLTVVNKAGTCKIHICKSIIIGNNCKFEADFAFEIENNSIKVSAKSNATSPEYTWDFGDGNIGQGTINMNQYTKDGTYTVCLTIFDKSAECTSRICKKVEIKSPCNFNGDFKFEVTDKKVTFTASSSNADVKYYWDFGNGKSGEGIDISHEYTANGIYKVCLIITDGVTCKTQVCKKVIVGRTTIDPKTGKDIDRG